MSEWAHVRVIARTELRRKWRAAQKNAGQMIGIVIMALFFVPLSFAGIFGAFVFGAGIGSGDIETPLEWSRIALIYAWVLVAAFGGYRAYSTALRPDRLDGSLTTVSHRELIGGIAFSELLLWGIPAAGFTTLAALAFAAGSQSILAAPLSFVAVWLVLLTALTFGFLLALAIRNSGVRSKLLTRLRTVFVALLGVAYFGVIFTQNITAVFEPLYLLLEPTPVGWFGDLVLLGTTPEASTARGVGAVLASTVFLVAGVVALGRLAELLWYADGVHVERESESAAASTDESRLAAFLPRPVVGVVLADWKRARRAPITLSFVLYPLIVLINPTMSVIQTGTVGSSFPLWLVLCGGWIAGALFTLNVVGNEGAVLPSTLLGAAPGRALVGGHALAGSLLLAPITVGSIVVLGLLSPHSLAAVATLAVSGLVLVACAGPIASGIGAVFPRYEAVSVSRSSKAIIPSTLAFTVYSVVLVLVAVPTLFGHSAIVGGWLASLFGTSEGVIAVAGTLGTVLLAVALGALSARYATHSVETFHLD
ncbi:hypothetical protein ACLI4Z_13605 [Natrialbaceae archaeon A-arb3/5]